MPVPSTAGEAADSRGLQGRPETPRWAGGGLCASAHSHPTWSPVLERSVGKNEWLKRMLGALVSCSQDGSVATLMRSQR